jgi:hypothetical protein
MYRPSPVQVHQTVDCVGAEALPALTMYSTPPASKATPVGKAGSARALPGPRRRALDEVLASPSWFVVDQVDRGCELVPIATRPSGRMAMQLGLSTLSVPWALSAEKNVQPRRLVDHAVAVEVIDQVDALLGRSAKRKRVWAEARWPPAEQGEEEEGVSWRAPGGTSMVRDRGGSQRIRADWGFTLLGGWISLTSSGLKVISISGLAMNVRMRPPARRAG